MSDESDDIIISETEPIVHVITEEPAIANVITEEPQEASVIECLVEESQEVNTEEVTVCEVITEESVEPVIIESIAVGPQGPQGLPGDAASEYHFPFSWGDAAPAIVMTLPVDSVIRVIDLLLLVSFDGVGSSLSLGTTDFPELFMKITECDSKTIGVYSTNPGYKCFVETVVRLFITPGSGANVGNGLIVIKY